jgi:hypothetical protein
MGGFYWFGEKYDTIFWIYLFFAMKRIFLSILIFLVILLGSIAGMIWFFSTSNIPETNHTNTASTPSASSPSYSDLLKAKEEQSIRDTAAYNKAISSRTDSLCEGITEEKKKTECHDTIMALQAESSENLESCARISSTSIAHRCEDAIHQNIAIKGENKDACEKIQDITLEQYCRETIDEKKLQTLLTAGTLSANDCQSLEEKFQDTCRSSIQEDTDQAAYTKALWMNNIAYCTLIKDMTLRATCSDTILLKTALTNNAPENCEKIQDTAKKTYCTSHVASRNEAALFKEYIANSNLSGCATLSDTNLKNRCHDMVTLSLARTTQNASLCQTLTNTGMIAMCQQSAK